MIDLLIALLMLLSRGELCDQGIRLTRLPQNARPVSMVAVVDVFELVLFDIHSETSFAMGLIGYDRQGEQQTVCLREIGTSPRQEH